MSSDREAADAQDDRPPLRQTQHAPRFRAARQVRPGLYGEREEADPFLRDAPPAKVSNSPFQFPHGPHHNDLVRPL